MAICSQNVWQGMADYEGLSDSFMQQQVFVRYVVNMLIRFGKHLFHLRFLNFSRHLQVGHVVKFVSHE